MEKGGVCVHGARMSCSGEDRELAARGMLVTSACLRFSPCNTETVVILSHGDAKGLAGLTTGSVSTTFSTQLLSPAWLLTVLGLWSMKI